MQIKFKYDPAIAAKKGHNSNNRNYKAFKTEFGRARIPAAPQSEHNEIALNNDCGEPGVFALPIRKHLDHRGPLSIDVSDTIYFITIAAARDSPPYRLTGW